MKKLFTYLFTIVSIVITTQLMAQSPEIEWQNTVGGNSLDVLVSIQQTSDTGYILGGYSESDLSGDKTEASLGSVDYWVIKLDKNGTIEWQNTIGGSDIEYLISIQQTKDEGYILGGYSYSGISSDKTEELIGGSYDYWIIKLDVSGNIEWQNTIGGNGNDAATSIIQTYDGGYFVGGYSDSDISPDKSEDHIGSYDYWVVKLYADGNIEWDNTIGGTYDDFLFSVEQTFDSGYILGGYSDSGITGDKTEVVHGEDDYWVIKIDSVGAIEWQNTIGGNGYDAMVSVQQTTDDGFILGGYSNSDISEDKSEDNIGGYDFWILKLDNIGLVEWQNTIGGNSSDNLFTIQQTIDGEYIIIGHSSSDISDDKTENSIGPGTSSDYWVVKIDEAGNIKWDNTIGGNDSDYATDIQFTTDGGYILAGYSGSGISGDKTEPSEGSRDYWVVRLKGCNAPVDITMSDISICSGYPILLHASSGVEITWSPAAYLDTTAGNSVTANPPETISYTVTAMDSVGCYSSDIITITVNTLPLPSINIDDNILCTELFSSYQWQSDTIDIAGATSQCYAITESGNYRVSVTDANNCSAVSDIFSFTSIEDYFANNNFLIYPNPAKDEFTIEFNSTDLNQQQINISIANIWSEEILNKKSEMINGKLSEKIFLNQPSGFYIIKITAGESQYEKKILIE